MFLKDYADFVPMNEVYITYFGEVKPVSVVPNECSLDLADIFWLRLAPALRC